MVVFYTMEYLVLMNLRTQQQTYGFSLPASIYQWVEVNISKPFKGFEHKRNQDGTFYSYEQQIYATRAQVVSMAYELIKKGWNDIKIISWLECQMKCNLDI